MYRLCDDFWYSLCRADHFSFSAPMMSCTSSASSFDLSYRQLHAVPLVLLEPSFESVRIYFRLVRLRLARLCTLSFALHACICPRVRLWAFVCRLMHLLPIRRHELLETCCSLFRLFLLQQRLVGCFHRFRIIVFILFVFFLYRLLLACRLSVSRLVCQCIHHRTLASVVQQAEFLVDLRRH